MDLARLSPSQGAHYYELSPHPSSFAASCCTAAAQRQVPNSTPSSDTQPHSSLTTAHLLASTHYWMFAVDAALRTFCTVLGATISSEVSIAVTHVVWACSNGIPAGGPFSASPPRHGTILGSIWSSPRACARCTHRSWVGVAHLVATLDEGVTAMFACVVVPYL